MIRNRSVPCDAILPHVVYEDVGRASVWLKAHFGFTERYRYGEPAQGAMMSFGAACIMLTLARPGRSTPASAGSWTQSLTLFTEDVDAHYRVAKAAGVNIVEDLHETEYGERQYAALDPDGHHWLFSTHVRDVSPAEWDAIIAI